MKKAKFKVRWLPDEYEGYYTDQPSDTFNGEHVPLFTQDVYVQIIADIIRYMEAEKIPIDGKQANLYPLGAYAWQWEKVEE